MNVGVVIVAAGNGTRMNSTIRKPYIEFNGIPILIHTIKPFITTSQCAEVVIVVHADELIYTKQLLEEHGITEIKLVAGGKERQDSVEIGLRSLTEKIEYVLIHDGARPFLSDGLIKQLIHEVKERDAVIPALPVKDTIKVVDGEQINHTPDRQRLWAAQTPQAFSLDLIRQCYEKVKKEGYVATDDASILEKCGVPVYIMNGEYTNIKITTKEDLLFGELILRKLEE